MRTSAIGAKLDGKAKLSLRLRASRRKTSGRCVFPEVPAHSVLAAEFEPILLSGDARLYSHTTIHPNPKTGLRPFVLVYADFPEGVRVFGRLDLAEGQNPRIGMVVRAVVSEGTDGDREQYFFVAAEGTA